MLVHVLSKYETVKAELLQRNGIREVFAVILSIALFAGSVEKICEIYTMDRSEYSTAELCAAPTAMTYGLDMDNFSYLCTSAVRNSSSIPAERMKSFEKKTDTAAQDMVMPVQSETQAPVSDVTVAAVPDHTLDSETQGTLPEDTTGQTDDLTNIKGFLCNADGVIVGCDGLQVTDGVLNLTTDARCTAIADGAFAGLGSDVFEIYIPANIIDISESAFDGLPELFYIEVHPDNPVYGSANGVLYRKP